MKKGKQEYIEEIQKYISELNAAIPTINYYVHNLDNVEYDQVQHIHRWLTTAKHLLDEVTKVRNMIPQSMWDYYAMMEFEELTEQVLLAKAEKNLRDYLRTNKPKMIVKGHKTDAQTRKGRFSQELIRKHHRPESESGVESDNGRSGSELSGGAGDSIDHASVKGKKKPRLDAKQH